MSSPSNSEPVGVKIGLRIEEDPTVPVELVQVAIDPTTKVIVIVATNFAADAMGAVSVMNLLRIASDGIASELGNTTVLGVPAESGVGEQKSSRPRFNPQPRARSSADKKE